MGESDPRPAWVCAESWRAAISSRIGTGIVATEGDGRAAPLLLRLVSGNGCSVPYTDNSGVAHVYGDERQINALLVPGLVLSANAGYANVTFVIGSLAAGITPGTPVQDVPDWTSMTSLSYKRSLVAEPRVHLACVIA